MVKKKRLADTPFAQWLAVQMGKWVDPETGMYGMNQNQLAKAIDVAQGAVSGLLKDGRTPAPTTLNKVAELFDVSPLMLYQMVYLPDKEEIAPEVLGLVNSLDKLTSQMPDEVRKRFLESVWAQAEMQAAALQRFEETEDKTAEEDQV